MRLKVSVVCIIYLFLILTIPAISQEGYYYSWHSFSKNQEFSWKITQSKFNTSAYDECILGIYICDQSSGLDKGSTISLTFLKNLDIKVSTSVELNNLDLSDTISIHIDNNSYPISHRLPFRIPLSFNYWSPAGSYNNTLYGSTFSIHLILPFMWANNYTYWYYEYISLYSPTYKTTATEFQTFYNITWSGRSILSKYSFDFDTGLLRNFEFQDDVFDFALIRTDLLKTQSAKSDSMPIGTGIDYWMVMGATLFITVFLKKSRKDSRRL